MNIEIEKQDRNAIARVSGTMTMENSDALLSRLSAFHQQQPASRVIVDLSGLTGIDSSGIGALIECRHHFRSLGVELLLAGVAGKVQLTLRVARADTLFEIFTTTAEALAAK